MNRRRVRVQVVNGDWEIRKYKIKERLNEFKVVVKENIKPCAYCFMFGVGVATVYYVKKQL